MNHESENSSKILYYTTVGSFTEEAVYRDSKEVQHYLMAPTLHCLFVTVESTKLCYRLSRINIIRNSITLATFSGSLCFLFIDSKVLEMGFERHGVPIHGSKSWYNC